MPNSSAEVVAIRSKIPASLLSQYVQSDILSLVEVVLDPGLSAEQGAAAVIAIQEVIADSDAPPGTTVTQTGDLVFNLQTNIAMSLQMIILIVVAMVLLVLVLGLLFGYVNYRFLPVLMVGMGLVVTFGILGFAGVLIGMAAIGAFPILIGLGIDYSIQFHSRLEEEARRGPLPGAVRVTMENTGPAVLYALIATSMGFAALFISPVPMIRNFAVVAIIGIATCYAVSLVGIPVVARLVTYRPKGGASEARRADRVRPRHRRGLGPDREEPSAPARRRPPRGTRRCLARPGDPDRHGHGLVRAPGHARAGRAGQGHLDHGLDLAGPDLRHGGRCRQPGLDAVDARVRGLRARQPSRLPDRRDQHRRPGGPGQQRGAAGDGERTPGRARRPAGVGEGRLPLGPRRGAESRSAPFTWRWTRRTNSRRR